MAQWSHMTQMIQCLSDETISSLYPPPTFPIEVRHFLSEWIESQRWDDFELEKVEQESQAQVLLEKTITMLQTIAQRNTSVVDKMKLMQISRNMIIFQQNPLQFAVMVRDILRKERVLLSSSSQINSPTQYQPFQPRQPPKMLDLDNLVIKVLEVQEIRQQIHHLQEELNWERQNCEDMQGQLLQNGHNLDTTADIQKVQSHIQKLEFNVKTMATNRIKLLKECVDCLDQCQNQLIARLKKWRWEQHKATIGHPFDDDLNPLQTWCEQLLGVNGKLRQELILSGELIQELRAEHERLGQLLQILIQNSLVVDKQPPQVIKTQSKFSSTVRYLLGEKVATGKPVVVKAQIINELQARNLSSVPGDNVGELINNTAILEHNTSTKTTCATFRNMSIKKIKRADRKGSESVTEEKFAILFSTEISITGCDTPYKIQMISLPVVIIVHGSQDNNALATIIWDCAFSEPFQQLLWRNLDPFFFTTLRQFILLAAKQAQIISIMLDSGYEDRVPFVVPERVPWRMMCNTLNSKFTSEVQTEHKLDQYNQHFLAQKIFDKPDFLDDLSNMMVSWTQFNKEVLPGRPFTFWQWFEGVMELTKKHLKTYWSDGLIFGFIGKQHLHLILKDRPNGTFLLRFSDSEIGGITIAYVSACENGGQVIQNIQPFSKRDLEIRSLGDRIRDIGDITYLYPDFPKHEVFQRFYTVEPQQLPSRGYIPVSLQTKVGMNAGSDTPPPPVMTPMPDNFSVPFSPQESIPQDMDTVPTNDFNSSVFQTPEDIDLECLLQTLNP